MELKRFNVTVCRFDLPGIRLYSAGRPSSITCATSSIEVC